MRTRTSLVLLALMPCIAPLAGAERRGHDLQDTEASTAPAAEQTDELTAKVEAAIAEYEADYKAWVSKIRAASEEERKTLFGERPKPDECAAAALLHSPACATPAPVRRAAVRST